MRWIIVTMLALAGCSAPPDVAARRDLAVLALPTAATLPVRHVGQTCNCVQQDRCITLEERSGWTDVRAVECEWAARDIARCQYETRFTDDLGERQIAGEWVPNDEMFRALPGGGYCAMANADGVTPSPE